MTTRATLVNLLMTFAGDELSSKKAIMTIAKESNEKLYLRLLSTYEFLRNEKDERAEKLFEEINNFNF